MSDVLALPRTDPVTEELAIDAMAEEAAFAAFYHGAHRRVVGQVVAVTGDLDEAEDVAQEAFLQAAKRWADVRYYDVPEAWVRRIAVNLAVSGHRRAARKARALVRLRASTPAAVEGADRGVERLALAQALRTVPWRYRVVLALHYYADLSVAEVAEELGIPESTVKTRLARGRRRLGELLTDPDDSDGRTGSGGAR